MASRDPCEAGVAVHLGLRSQADLHEKLWTAVRHGGCDGFLEIPKTRFDVDLYVDYEDQQRAMSSFKSYCRHQGELLGVDASWPNVVLCALRQATSRVSRSSTPLSSILRSRTAAVSVKTGEVQG